MNERHVTIAVIAPHEPFEVFSDFWEGVWSAAYELAPLGVQLNSIPVESLNADQQVQSLEQLLTSRPDVVVLLPTESKRLDELIERHTQQGTPVVTVFNDAPQSRRVLFVGPDCRVAGSLAAQMLENSSRPKSRIAALTGSALDARVQQQFEGFQETLRMSSSACAVTEFKTPEALLAAMNADRFSFDAYYLGSETPELSEILERLPGSARAVAFGLTEITRLHLESGTLCAVIDSSRYYQGYLAVQEAYECVHSHRVEPRWVSIPSTVLLPVHASAGPHSALLETVVRQRTRQLHNYKKELETANARLMRVAETDPATGLLNRRKAEEVLDQFVDDPDLASVALLAIVLDDANEIAGLLGQTALDQAIQAVISAAQPWCRPGDILARSGPFELAVIFPDTPFAVAQGLSDRILAVVQEARMAADPDLVLSVSSVLVCSPVDGRTGEELRSAAADSLRKIRERRALPLRWLRKTG